MTLPIALSLTGVDEVEFDQDAQVKAIAMCAGALKQARVWRADVHLLTERPFAELQVSPGRTLVSFLSESHVKEELRLMMSLANRAPSLALDAGIEVSVGGRSHWAAQVAYERDGIILTLPLLALWKTTSLHALVSQVSDVGEIFEEEVYVENVYDVDSCVEHRQVIQSRGRGLPSGGASEVWKRRGELFPSLKFLRRVESDLLKVAASGGGISQIFNRLVSINGSAQQWAMGGVAYPVWGSKVTNESETRRADCQFSDDNGDNRVYEIHARYTPGAGRIHFRLIEEFRMVEVAYIGLKIGR
ncbi:hypothetical protein N5D13_10375 [Stenotrophomonas maltophilia]|uniref:hypothetical protein n=1 Tax=Stenotrophomonas maltophilia TaxID=40324 RepID=UPI0021CAD9F3|nr:hypothetical protein [Stenotrophomonas maltophilia]MCU1015428.1 hypothetical protein [Stenotrophomonas maltophilia]MDH0072919.1 hypothetical protein [Stenotrophomonas maltophilia]MDH0105689.1 hypothetical protein [Stenotrophomonas maltophilia]MDH0332310.1 hypothetical protein [Stenotrophomonas maltophilia]MDH0633274.1 hypothetical protein [Stenotrophomonas maltophilia]